jgi:hypothetical protein
MKLNIVIIIIIINSIACSSSKKISKNNIVTDNYGYMQNEPINVGGVYTSGAANQREYLNSLSGPNGEEVSFVRVGSCCPFKTKNSSFNSGLLDIYKVTYDGKGDTVRLYLNLYDEEPVRAPLGFKFR